MHGAVGIVAGGAGLFVVGGVCGGDVGAHKKKRGGLIFVHVE